MQSCRGCGRDNLKNFIDLGFSPPSNSYMTVEELNTANTYFPLKVLFCEDCYFVQTLDVAERELFFNENYAYFSGYSSTWIKHCEAYANQMNHMLNLNNSDLIIEIASNDGTLLESFKNLGVMVLGIEPTLRTAEVAISKNITTLVEFFGESLAENLIQKEIKPRLIVGNNVLAHVPDINDFIKGLSKLMNENTVATFEFPHLLELIKYNQFDTVYHEHFSYLSLIAIEPIFSKFGLKIFDVEKIHTHGGSLRIFIKKIESKFEVSPNVNQVITEEQIFGLNSPLIYSKFQDIIENVKNDFLLHLISSKKKKKKIAAFGAAAKGNTLLNFAGIKCDLIDFVVDSNTNKQGLFLPGSAIPILDPSALLIANVDEIVILPWNLTEEIVSYVRNILRIDCPIYSFIPTKRVF